MMLLAPSYTWVTEHTVKLGLRIQVHAIYVFNTHVTSGMKVYCHRNDAAKPHSSSMMEGYLFIIFGRPDAEDPVMDACLLHCINHCSKTAELIKKNNQQAKADPDLDPLRDQGFTRPKVDPRPSPPSPAPHLPPPHPHLVGQS